MAIETFHWRWCTACAKRGYRRQFTRKNMAFDGLDFTLPTWEAVSRWHDKTDQIMWDDFINRSKPNGKT